MLSYWDRVMKKTPAVFVITLLFVAILTLSVNGQTQGPFVGSKESDVYHYPSCSYVSNIKEENKVWFTDAQDAVNHDYHPCLRCKPPLPSSSTPSPTATPTAFNFANTHSDTYSNADSNCHTNYSTSIQHVTASNTTADNLSPSRNPRQYLNSTQQLSF